MTEIEERLDIRRDLTFMDNQGFPAPKAVKPIDKASWGIRITLILLALTTVYGLATMDTGGVDIPKAVADTLGNFKIVFFHPISSRLTLHDAALEILITVGLACLTTVFGGIVAFFLGLMAARNLSPKWLTDVVKMLVAVIRAIPTILWVFIFAIAAGLGSTAAVIGLTFHSVGYLTKAFAECFEDLDDSVIEALQASGANWWQIVFQAVIPSSASYLLAWIFFRFEMNFGNAVAMGAAAGAAGIGFDLFMASGFYFDLNEVGMITYFILVFAVILEVISTKIKAKVS